MNVDDQRQQIPFAVNWLPMKWFFKQRACTPNRFIDRFGIGDKQVLESVAGFAQPKLFRSFCVRLNLSCPIVSLLFFSSRADGKVEMIGQQTVSKRLRHRQDVFCVLFHKVGVVALLLKQVLTVVASIIDVIVLAELECFYWHGFLSEKKSLKDFSFLPRNRVARVTFADGLFEADFLGTLLEPDTFWAVARDAIKDGGDALGAV